MKDSAGRKSGEDNKSRNKKCAHKPNAKYDDEGTKNCKDGAEELGVDADGVGEFFVESESEDLIVKEKINDECDDGENDADDKFGLVNGKDAAK